MKELVVYFSRKGRVRKVAQDIAQRDGAELLELKTPERTRGFLGFWWCGRFGMHRWEMPLEEYDADLGAFDKVVICSPVWVFSLSAPVRAFLQSAKGKIKAADYVLVHFSFPMKYPKTVKLMDETLGVKHGSFTSVACQWGRFYRFRTL